MGSQQLLLIVLGVIIVGIAVVVGIDAFAGNSNQANRDAISHDMIQMAASAQAYFHKPKLLGGGGKSFIGITVEDMGYEDQGGGRHTNENAEYFIVPLGAQYVYIIGRSTVVDFAYIVMRVEVDDMRFYVVGWGRSDTDPT